MGTGSVFDLEEESGPGKVMPLADAVARFVKPGMLLHFANGADANGALREIIRCFHGRDPRFSVVAAGITNPGLIALTLDGLVKRVITSNCSYTYPAPRPVPLFQKLVGEGAVEVESWSLYSLEQRLMAAALGVAFMPTKSLSGSGMGEENRDDFKVVKSPFDGAEAVGVVRALAPDLSIVHGCVADAQGNTVLAPPYFAALWGPKAAKNGVIVTVEAVVPAEFIRRKSTLVKIPGLIVEAVCPVPLGAHPQGLAGRAVGLPGYAEDYDFIVDFVTTGKDERGLKEWAEKWVFDCPSQEEYLKKLGAGRVRRLKKDEGEIVKGVVPAGENQAKANPTETMIVCAAREIRETCLSKGYRSILSGIGAPGLAAWLAFYLMKREGARVDLLSGPGQVGFAPRPGDPFLMTLSNVTTSTMLTDSTEVYGAYVGGANNRCLAVVGAAQVDRSGNVNTVRVGGLYFIGVGGAADALSSCETVVVARQSADRFLERVPFVGLPGAKVSTLVTDLGVFKKLGGDTFLLAGFHAFPPDAQDPLQAIRKRCGWDLAVAAPCRKIPAPTREELSLLRALDPEHIFTGK